MEFRDKTLTCRDCDKPFVWTAGEQSFFREKELTNIPARCPECRTARKARMGIPGRALSKIICAECGRETTVPFVPRNGNPVYCSTCLVTIRVEAPAPIPSTPGAGQPV